MTVWNVFSWSTTRTNGKYKPQEGYPVVKTPYTILTIKDLVWMNRLVQEPYQDIFLNQTGAFVNESVNKFSTSYFHDFFICFRKFINIITGQEQ